MECGGQGSTDVGKRGGLGLHPDLSVFTQPLDTTKGTPNADCRPVASELAQWRQLGGPCVPRTGGRLYPQPGPQPRGAVSSVWRLWGPPRVGGVRTVEGAVDIPAQGLQALVSPL